MGRVRAALAQVPALFDDLPALVALLQPLPPKDVASILQTWLSELPEPLIPAAHLQALHLLFGRPSPANPAAAAAVEVAVAALQEWLLSLPPVSRYLLTQLVQLAHRISSHAEDNRMTVGNVSKVLAPLILVSADLAAMVRDLPLNASIMEHFVRVAPQLWLSSSASSS
jgi:hypothetical protein